MDDHTPPSSIDVHCHAVPPKYRQHLLDNGYSHPDGMPSIPPWTPESHIQLMTQQKISRSILSISSPGTNLIHTLPHLASTVTREMNEELSSICRSHPEHFSFFASLPLPCISKSLEEIDYALDTLGAVGFAILSNAQGLYLGDPTFAPVLKKLDERKAVIFIHPTTCNAILPASPSQVQGHDPISGCWAGAERRIEPVTPLPHIPNPMLEFLFDSTRAITSILLSSPSLLSTYPNLSFIISHCGAVLPSIIDRISAFDSIVHSKPNSSEKLRKLLRERFYFDLAGVPFPDQIHALARMLGGTERARERCVYGSDFPFTPAIAVAMLGEVMDRGLEEIFGVEGKGMIYEGNARGLFGF